MAPHKIIMSRCSHTRLNASAVTQCLIISQCGHTRISYSITWLRKTCHSTSPSPVMHVLVVCVRAHKRLGACVCVCVCVRVISVSLYLCKRSGLLQDEAP